MHKSFCSGKCPEDCKMVLVDCSCGVSFQLSSICMEYCGTIGLWVSFKTHPAEHIFKLTLKQSLSHFHEPGNPEKEFCLWHCLLHWPEVINHWGKQCISFQLQELPQMGWHEVWCCPSSCAMLQEERDALFKLYYYWADNMPGRHQASLTKL